MSAWTQDKPYVDNVLGFTAYHYVNSYGVCMFRMIADSGASVEDNTLKGRNPDQRELDRLYRFLAFRTWDGAVRLYVAGKTATSQAPTTLAP